MRYSLRNDQKGILLDRKAEVPDSLLPCSFFYKRYNKLRLAICRNDAFPSGDNFFKPVNMKAECMFQIGIHIDNAFIRIFAKGIAIFLNDYGILGILHYSGFLRS